ncbi:MAG: DsbC family protein [Chromatiaceae bacterium]
MNVKMKIGLASAVLALFSAQAAADAASTIKKSLAKILPEYEVNSVHETPVPDLYEVLVGSDVIYVSKDGRYMVQGRMIDLVSKEDLTETSPRLAEARKKEAKERVAAVDKLGEDTMIVFAPPGKAEHTITVFTDLDCGYCRKLHSEIDGYLAEGIKVRYLFFPRAGVGTPSFDKAVSVWCADDRKAALTDAKAGKAIPEKKCENPVKAQMELGEKLGVSGTPAIILESGEMVPGYVPPKRLAAMLNEKKG